MGVQCEGVEGATAKPPSSLPQERNPLRNKKMQLVFPPKSNEFK